MDPKRNGKRAALGLIALAALGLTARADGLDALLDGEAVWRLSAEAFMGDYQSSGFAFVDGQRVAKSSHPELRFLGLRVWEARVYFDAAALSRVELSLYNKGDAGDLDQESFKELIARCADAVSAFAGSKGMTGKTSNDRPNYYVNRRQWSKKPVGLQLEWAFVNAHRSGGQSVPFRAEFVKVLLVPVKENGVVSVTGGTPAWANNATARTVKVNVKSNAEGDVWVDNVPMVDQGQKGYCAAASAERLLRYYGRPVDQHEIAQLADTAAKGGTSLDGMVEALDAVGKKYQLDQKDLIRSDSAKSFEKSRFNEMIDQYNRVAKQKKQPQLDYMDFAEETAPNVRSIDTMKIYAAMDAETLKESKTRQSQGLESFRKNIVQYTAQGVPLVWACIVGKYPEKPDLGAEGAFGHIRLIIGYNAKTQEVLYSDSWGMGHTLKRLPIADAWAMTFGLTVLKPRDVR
jgi:hypothetical protein